MVARMAALSLNPQWNFKTLLPTSLVSWLGSGNSVTLTLSFLAATAVLCILVFLVNGRRSSKLPLPPGPFNWPVVGSLFRLGSQPHRSLETLARKYGPIMYLRLGSLSTVVVSDAEMAKQILQKHDAEFSSRPPSMITEYMTLDYSSISFSPASARHTMFRKIVKAELASASRLSASSGIREEESAAVVNLVWPTQSSSTTVTLRPLLQSASMNIMSRILFGKRFFDSTGKPMPDVEGLLHLFVRFCSALGKPNFGDLLPWTRRLDLQGLEKDFADMRVKVEQLMANLLEQHKQQRLSQTSNRQECFLDVLLALEGESKLSDKSIKAVSWDVFAAGTDTTAVVTEWALALLIRHPGILAKAQDEVDKVVGSLNRVKESDVPKLSYIQAIIKETQRVQPVTALGVPHFNTEEAVVVGFRIPAKTQVLVNLWAMMHDPAAWPNPLQFKPERFLEQDISPYGQDFRYLPFSTGRRGCPGAALGMTSVTLSLATLIHAFDWTLPDGQLPEDMDLVEKSLMVTAMRSPLVAVATPRLPVNVYGLAR